MRHSVIGAVLLTALQAVPAYAGGGPGPTLPFRYTVRESTGTDWTTLQDRNHGSNNAGQRIYNQLVNGSFRAGLSNPDGSASVLASLPGTTESSGQDVNNRGAVVGLTRYPGGPLGHATVWNPGLQPVDIGPVGGDFFSNAISINDWGDIAVIVQGGPLGPANAWGGLFHEGTLFRLDEYVDTPGIQVTEAHLVNNHGDVLGEGYLNGRLTGLTLLRAQPAAVPEPGTMALVLIGGMAAARFRRKA